MYNALPLEYFASLFRKGYQISFEQLFRKISENFKIYLLDSDISFLYRSLARSLIFFFSSLPNVTTIVLYTTL